MHGSSRQTRAALSVALLALVMLVASGLAARVQSSGGQVAVRTIVLPTQGGQWLTADLFKPATATPEHPAPLVVVVPGFQRSKETLSNLSIELSRRGVVVVAIDPYGQGGSSSSLSRQSATTQGYGMFAVVDYAFDTDNLDYVDKTRIAATGHSAGGNAAIRGASHFGRLARETGTPSKLQSIYVSGYLLTLTEKVLRDVRSNVGVSYAYFDEGSYRNELGNGDMTVAPEARRTVASGLGGRAVPERIEIGRWYGDDAARTLRIVHNERTIHPFQPYSHEAMRHQLEFFEHVFGLDASVPADAQIWQRKELLTFVALVAALAMILPLARLLLRLPAFAGLVRPLPPPPERPRGARRWLFWIVVVVSGLVAGLSFIPLSEWSQQLFVAASNREPTWFFPQRMNNAVMLWAGLNGLVGFALFFASSRLAQRGGPVDAAGGLGVRISPGELARTAALAVAIAATFFVLLFGIHYLFHVDYRFVFLGVRAFQPAVLLLVPMYALPFFVFFLQNSLRVNAGMCHAGVPEWRGLLLAGVANTFGLALILVLQYGVFAATGTVFWTDGWLYVNLLFAVVPIMFVLPLFHRAFFRMTGRIWLGPMAMCLVFVTILLSNTVCYFPL
ncbi:MAG: prolyl oligopeptidase family serine peptidase [Planctomycetes bacterium]|nr:prolyl oligopeptidase family serine peptidase [Planctomycetota bacterium]